LTVKREVLILVAAVLVVDAIFAAAYFLGHVDRSADRTKLVFTALWTGVTLLVVIRGLTRVRRARVSDGARHSSP
jgi:hypothetical protein